MADETAYAQGDDLDELAEAAREYVDRIRATCRRLYGPEVWDAMPVGDRAGALVSVAVQPLLQGSSHEAGAEGKDAFQGLGVGVAAILAPMGDKARQAALLAMGLGIQKSATSVANMDTKGRA